MKLKLKEFTSFCNLVSVPVLLLALSSKKIVVANELSEELFGYSHDELLSLEIAQLFVAQNRKNIEALIEICANNSEGFKLKESEMFIRRKTGRRCPVEIACCVFQLKDEKFILFNIVDLSALKSKHDEKEMLIQDNLRISKLADLSRLASGMAHELNNPLAIITGYTDFLEEYLNRENKSFEVIQKNIKPIKNNVTRMANIISKLMKMFRSEEIKFSSVSVKSIINLALNAIKSQIDNTNIIISLDVDDYSIYCDLLYTEQVVINILNNAITALSKFTDIRLINIRTHETINDICISINNNGAPIPEKYHDKIFTPFFTTKQIGEGVGLGLYLAQNIMKIHEGRITFETNPKIGTTFNLFFPKRSSMMGNLEKGKKTMLIVSENLDFRKQCHDLFTPSGLKGLEARDFNEATNILSRHKIDALLVELDFQKKNDFEILTNFIQNNTTTPIIILTNRMLDVEVKKIEKIKNVYIFSSDLTMEEITDISLVVEQYQSIKELKAA